jgi:electron transfer flavoprotein-quinone oxidoreductase
MGSGMYAAEAAVEAVRAGDVSAAGLAGYERRLKSTFVLRDHHRLQRAPELVLSDRVQHLYPKMVNRVVERMFRVDNPKPKPRVHTILREERHAAGIRWRDMVSDSIAVARAFL